MPLILFPLPNGGLFWSKQDVGNLYDPVIAAGFLRSLVSMTVSASGTLGGDGFYVLARKP